MTISPYSTKHSAMRIVIVIAMSHTGIPGVKKENQIREKKKKILKIIGNSCQVTINDKRFIQVKMNT